MIVKSWSQEVLDLHELFSFKKTVFLTEARLRRTMAST